MRHRKRRTRLSMMGSRRKATLRNMVKSLIKHQRIETTLARAKEARRIAEPLITLSKTDTVSARQQAFSILTDRDLVGKLFKETAGLFKNRTSGYTRIIISGFRRGDGATMAILELTEKTMAPKKPKKEKKEKAAAQPREEGQAKEAVQAQHEERKKEAAKKEEPRKEEPRHKHKPTLEEEKKHEKARSEEKKISEQKGFMKNIRGLFRKRGDR
jgi:large subunit ribosomal protein L17